MADQEQNGAAGDAPPAVEHLNIKVTDNNNKVSFKIKRSTEFERSMNAFYERQGKDVRTVRFLFDGQRVTQQDTPDILGMCDGDHSTMADQEQNGAAGDAPYAVEHLNIKVTNGGNVVLFKVKRSTKLEKVMNTFCERQGKDVRTVRFLFDGQRVTQQDTPDTLEMSDGDTLEVHQEQIGGA